ncbi:zinc metalloproteinase nas-6-like [Spodoptera frugiperda]|uniref:Metalloendopeptidase n=1 Tax=Spodoptera frugiperda TaxID=7108 RepID=A0A9R0DAX7_SPOFR|nr:zinc metalloproteinase nas-6-like [Spodoptera frugiperda]
MFLQSLLKCSISFFIIFLICPNGIQTLASIGKQQQYYHAVRKSGGADFQQPILSSDLTRRLLLEGDDENRYSINEEPGFDLTPEEIKKFKLWPDGIIPYYIDVVSFSDKVLRDQIRTSLSWLNSKTALSFQELPTPPEDGETRWAFFANRRGQLGCSDHSIQNFSNTGVQLVHLGYDCMGGDLADALLLLVGVPAQHTAPDRDIYIKVVEKNILPEKRYLYKKLANTEWLFHDVAYDYASASHFDTHRHSMNGRATIEAQGKYGDNIGGQAKITKSDLEKIRMLYNYIVKKKSREIPDCDKLFKKSPKYYKRLDVGDEPKPRKKCNKYLGIDESDEHHNDDRDDDNLPLVPKEPKEDDENKSDLNSKENTNDDNGSLEISTEMLKVTGELKAPNIKDVPSIRMPDSDYETQESLKGWRNPL